MRNYYDILGVSSDASSANIEKAYYREKFENGRYWDENLNKAYSVLSNPESRRKYDEELEQNLSSDTYSTDSSTMEEVTPEEVTPEEVTPEEVTPEEVTPEEVTPEEVTPEEVTPEEVTPEEVTPEEVTPEEVTQEGADQEEQTEEEKTQETYEEIYNKELSDAQEATRFNPTEKTKKEKTQKDVFKKIGKYVGGTLIGFLVAGPIGAVVVPIWMKKRKKVKLQKEKTPKRIKRVSSEELDYIDSYNQNLEKEINMLLSQPHSNYRLEICRTKYQNQIELLKKLLAHKLSTKPSKGIIKYKFEIISLKNQLETARKNLESIEDRIKENNENLQLNDNSKNRLQKLNIEIEEANEKIAEEKANYEYANQNKEREKTTPITITNVGQKSRMRKRDKLANRKKFIIVKSGNFYDKLLKGKDFVKSTFQSFMPSDEIDKAVESELEKHR